MARKKSNYILPAAIVAILILWQGKLGIAGGKGNNFTGSRFKRGQGVSTSSGAYLQTVNPDTFTTRVILPLQYMPANTLLGKVTERKQDIESGLYIVKIENKNLPSGHIWQWENLIK